MIEPMSNYGAVPPGAETDSLGEALREVAGHFAGNIRTAAATLAGENKDRMASLGKGLAEALRHAAAALDEEGCAQISRRAGEAADRVGQFADRVRRQSWHDISVGVEDAARRRPLLFCAGALAVGFVAARLVADGAAPTAPPGAASGQEG